MDEGYTVKPDPLLYRFMESLWMLLIKESLPVWLVNPGKKCYNGAMANDQRPLAVIPGGLNGGEVVTVFDLSGTAGVLKQ